MLCSVVVVVVVNLQPHTHAQRLFLLQSFQMKVDQLVVVGIWSQYAASAMAPRHRGAPSRLGAGTVFEPLLTAWRLLSPHFWAAPERQKAQIWRHIAKPLYYLVRGDPWRPFYAPGGWN